MNKNVSFFLRLDFVKAIHVQLSDKGSEIAVLEMFGENIGGKSVDVFHDKALAIFSPRYDIMIIGILNSRRVTSTIL